MTKRGLFGTCASCLPCSAVGQLVSIAWTRRGCPVYSGTPGLLFPFLRNCSLAAVDNSSPHSSNGWPSVHSVWGLLGPGGCLFAQIAIHTRGYCCIPSRRALLMGHFPNLEGRHHHSHSNTQRGELSWTALRSEDLSSCQADTNGAESSRKKMPRLHAQK